MQGTARLLAVITVLLFSPQPSGEAQTLSTQVIVPACEKGEPPFKGEKFGNVSKNDFTSAKELLVRGATNDFDLQIKKSVCIVALWQVTHKTGLDQPQKNGTTVSDNDSGNPKGSTALDAGLHYQILALQKTLDTGQKTQDALREDLKEAHSRLYGTCLVISILAIILAGFAVIYSRSATRKALRMAGLL
jgi:hypothetical protein